MPDPEHTNIGVITYSNTPQFYAFASEKAVDPSVIVMGDIFSPFCPLPKSKLLLNVKTCRQQIELILDKVLVLHSIQSKALPRFGSSGSCAGSALKSAVDILGAESGKVLWFAMDIPSLGYGTLQSRNDAKLYNTDKEHTIFAPTDTYRELAGICNKYKVAVDVFACAHTDIDLASLAPISSYMGGQIYYYPSFNSAA